MTKMFEAFRVAFALLVGAALSSCGSITQPAAVRMDNGEVYIGTATAAVSGGTFTVNDPTGAKGCSGNYDAMDTRPTISAPFRCSDGRYGTVTITRNPDMQSGTGIVQLADGSTGRAAFGSSATTVFSSPVSLGAPLASAAASPSTGGYSSAGGYTGNCPTPDSIAADGKRCGARSAASRPGGYSGYTPSFSSRTTWVSGHYRNGHYVRGHSRRR